MDSQDLSKKVMDLLDDKKAKDIISINVAKVTTLTDYFIICNGTSDRHRKSLADDVQELMENEKSGMLSKEGYNSANWILLDYGDLVVNIFSPEAREKYSLERLWSDGVLSDLRSMNNTEGSR
ncbi:MAG: ribosome silencing factor [Clostridia bacterium]|nr:ribosome silencing factor [Clostridia bacterium]